MIILDVAKSFATDVDEERETTIFGHPEAAHPKGAFRLGRENQSGSFGVKIPEVPLFLADPAYIVVVDLKKIWRIVWLHA